MTTRCEQRNQGDNSKVEYQVFGVFRSRTKAAEADSGDKDHQWMSLEEMYEALKNRELIDATVNTYFTSLQPAHQAAMDAVVGNAAPPEQ
jgi:hypothetical protein